MKIAISSSGAALEDQLDTRFGRAAGFILFDTETRSTLFINNSQNLEAAQGAGIQSAQHVVNAGADVLITGHAGPKAFAVLSAAGVPVYLAKAGPVRQALAQWEAGELTRITGADVEGHWV